MSEESLLMIGGPLDGAVHTRTLGIFGAPYGAPTSMIEDGHYVRRKYLMLDETVLTCWVWSEGIRSLSDISV